jgi:acetyltransferase-like isoleucine patch superfamily enzyme
VKQLLRTLAEMFARHSVESRSSVTVAASARVNWRGIVARPPARLVIGDASIFDGSIASDREGSCVLIGQRTFIGNSTLVTAERIEIGSDVLISWGCTIVDHDSHHVEWARRRGDVDAYRNGQKNWEGIAVRPVHIADKAWIGFNVIILKGVKIGEGAVVAAGSVVTRDVAPFMLVGGNPARPIRRVEESSV